MNKYSMPATPITAAIIITAVLLLTFRNPLTLNSWLKTSDPEYNTTGRNDTKYVNINTIDSSLLVKTSYRISINSEFVLIPYPKYLGKNTQHSSTSATAAVTSHA